MKLYDQVITHILNLCRQGDARQLPVCRVDWPDCGKENLIFRQDMAYELGGRDAPASQLKGEIARVMKDAGYITDAVTTTEFPKKLVITLKYTDRAVPAITEVKRISKPGLRKYVAVNEIPAVLDGMGLAILSTSKGVMSGAEAKKAKVGGELICTVA